MIQLHQLPQKKSRPRKRVGRGSGSGRGRTAGRGHKGQKSRSGFDIPKGFEGGQTRLISRIPKFKGFKSKSKKPVIIHYSQLEKYFADKDKISLASLKKKGLIERSCRNVKILSDVDPSRGKTDKPIKQFRYFVPTSKKLNPKA
jgi:large subunit ribosomal protein L15